MFKILVVDDEVHLARSAARLLLRAGHEVHAVTSGAEAVEALATQALDLVVTDLDMPHVDGVEVTRAARQCATTVCVVMVSGWFGDRSRVHEAGVCITADKPADYVAVVGAVAGCRAGSRPCSRAVDQKLKGALGG
jgi:CheY-like chemotaxis protein